MAPEVGDVLPIVYDQLHALARRMQQERLESLHPTSVVHEAYARLEHAEGLHWESEAHFLAIAAKAMRFVIRDRARAKSRLKRGGPAVEYVTLDGVGRASAMEDIVAVHQVLEELEAIDSRRAEVIEMRLLAGMSCAEIASVLGLSARTVERDWRVARAWFASRLSEL